MKSFFLIMVAIVCATTIYAQDTMITQSGDIMTVYDVEISPVFVFYKTSNSASAPIQKIEKSQVFMIKRPDGTKHDLGGAAPVATVQYTTTAAACSDPEIEKLYNAEVSEAAKQRNKELIDAINAKHAVNTKSNPKKGAGYAFAVFGVTQNSCMTNDDVELSIDFGGYNEKTEKFYKDAVYRNQAVQFTVNNKTDKTIYIDCGNSFFIRGGKSEAYYIPSATSKVANVVYSQRVVAVPPFSALDLYCKLFLFGESLGFESLVDVGNLRTTHVMFTEINEKGKQQAHDFMQDELIEYSEASSPINYGFMMAYSFSEDCTRVKKLSVNLYLKEIFGTSVSAWSGAGAFSENDALGVGWSVGGYQFFDYRKDKGFPMK